MDLDSLIDLPTLPLRITTRVLDPLQLPSNSAGSLRGAFGHALYELVCVHRERAECPGCPMEPACSYPYLFETRAAADQEGTVGFRDLPRPYAIRSGLGERFALPGDTLDWSVTLIGRAIEHLPYFALAWQSMGSEGVGRDRARFELLQVRALDLQGATRDILYDRTTNLLRCPGSVIQAPELAAWPRSDHEVPSARLSSLEIRFLTPTLVKYRGQPAAEPRFHILWRSLQLRLSILRLAHGAGRPETDFQESIRRADSVRLASWAAREVNWDRYSRRQGQRIPMRGWVGVARYAGALAPFLPALKLGTLVGLGDNCTFGMGHYEIVLPACSP